MKLSLVKARLQTESSLAPSFKMQSHLAGAYRRGVDSKGTYLSKLGERYTGISSSRPYVSLISQ